MSSKGRSSVNHRSIVTCTLAGSVVAVTSLANAGIPAAQPRAGAPLAGLTPSELARFETGKIRYGTLLEGPDGLGPIFNKAGCFSCHSNPLGGWGSITVTRFGFADKGSFDPLAELGGSLLQVTGSGGCLEVVPPEANRVAMRLSNSSMAFGMIEAIPGDDILANADPDDTNADGISGVARIVEAVEDPGNEYVGRFGWKAQVATVLTFSADAAVNEMGLTNRFFGTESPPNGDTDILALCDMVADPEDHPDEGGVDFVDRVTDFQRFLAQPPQTPKSGMTGEALFNAVGCAQCHVAQWQTADDPSLEDAIRNKTIRPYSNFLLHDMGLLGDGIADGPAGELEMRTPTLWNLRTRDPMLHDGRAAGGSFFDRVAGSGGAIWWHDVVGSEAQASGAAFFALSPEEQEQVVAFLDSLGRREFDFDGDDDVDFFDFLDFKSCFLAPGVNPDAPCAVNDIDQDGDVDLDDFGGFLTQYNGVDGDCDKDGTSDLTEILLGADDLDQDGIPDVCQQCPGDLDSSGGIDGGDLGILLSAWGSTGPGDLDSNGVVDGGDLGILLSGWGACKG